MRTKAQRTGNFAAIALLLAVLFSSFPAEAQWQQLPTPNFRRAIRACFFFNEQVGFIAATGDIGIYKTTTAGQSWVQCNTPKGYAGDYTSIFMTDTLNGWASIEDLLTSSRLFRTTDGGLNWTAVGPIGSASCVYQTPSALVVTSRDLNTGSGLVSRDGGRTFTPGVLKVTNGVDFCDNTYGVVTGFMATPWMRTADGGATWQQITPQIVDECWGVYGVKGTPIFYTAAERDPNTYKIGGSSIRRSSDFGASWVTKVVLPIRTTGHVAGVGETIYVQADSEKVFNGGLTGLYRSTNQGATWVPVGGPTNDRDTRFAVLGCMGGVVYAFDANGHVFKTRNGGDGTLSEPPITTTFTPSPLTLTSPICGSDQASIVLKNLYCQDITLQSVSFADSTLGIIVNGGLRFKHIPTMPNTFGQDQGDSITIFWNPAQAYHHDTTITTHIHVRYFSNGLGRIVDTVLTFNAHAAGSAPQFTMSPRLFRYDTLHVCAPRDTSILFTNAGCDTLFITGATSLLGSGLSLFDSSGATVKFPYVLLPGAALMLKIHVAPKAAGTYSSTMLIHFVHQGIAKDSSFAVQSTVPFERAFLFPKAIAVDTISTCRSYDTVLTISNPGCDTLWINSLSLQLGTNFSLRNLPPLPKFILPDSSAQFVLRFAPTTIGLLTDSLIATIRALETPVRLAVRVSGVGTGGTSLFRSSLDPPMVDFGTRTRCDAPDSAVFTIVNPGCQAMTVRSVQLEGALSPPVTMSVTPALPKTVIDGDTVRIVIKMSPNASGTFVGRVHVQYRFGTNPLIDSLYPVTLTVIHGPRKLELDSTLRTMTAIPFCSTKDTSIILRNSGCDSLVIQLRNLVGSSFVLLNPKAVPFGLAAGQSDTIRIRFVPFQSGSAIAKVQLISNADTNPNPQVLILASATPTDTITFHATAEANYRVGDVALIDLKSDRIVTNKALQSIQWTLAYNGDVLTYLSANTTIPNAVVSVGQELRSALKTAYLPVSLTATSGELQLDPSKPIATIKFNTTISDSSASKIEFSNVTLNGGNASYQRCTLGSASATSTIELSLICGDSTIENFFRFGTKLPLSVDPAYPNPTIVSHTSTILLPYHTANDGAVELTVLNARGERMFEAKNPATTAGAHMFEIPSNLLDAGGYYFMLRQANAGRSATGMFVVLR